MDEIDIEDLVFKALLKVLEIFGKKALKEVQKWHQARKNTEIVRKEVEVVKKLKE
jgi:hypothetical protein